MVANVEIDVFKLYNGDVFCDVLTPTLTCKCVTNFSLSFHHVPKWNGHLLVIVALPTP
jgi:hypothetical protein